MAQIGKFEVQVEVKNSPEKFYGFFKNNLKELVTICPDQLLSIEGQSNYAGAVMLVKYELAGSPMSAKMKIEAVDDENNSITYSFLEGDPMKLYKTLKFTLEVKKGATGCDNIAKWSFEFEKINEATPNPHLYGTFAAMLSKVSDAYLLIQ